MKKTIYTLSLLAAALLALSCQKDSESFQQESSVTVLKATAETVGNALTRTEMAYGFDVLWNEGDQICVKNNTASATYTLQDGAGTTDGTFTCATTPFTSGSQVEAFYPKSLADNGSLMWPAKLTKDFTMPMYCKRTLAAGDAQKLNFKSLGGILQIVFVKNKQEFHIIEYVKVEDGSKTLSGTFTVDAEGKAVITATDKAGIRLETGMSKAPGWGASIINIALPAGTYDSMRLIFTDQDGNDLAGDISESVTIVQNGITKLIVQGNELKDITQSTGYATAITQNGDVMNMPWVRLWYKGPKFAAYNITVEGVTNKGSYYAWGAKKNGDDYNTSDKNLQPSEDPATALWGGNWRMPTKSELEGLINTCDRSEAQDEKQDYYSETYKNKNTSGNRGVRFTGRGDYSNNSIFLPAAGYWYNEGMHQYPEFEGSNGYYWSSTPDGNNYAWCLEFTTSGSSTVKTEKKGLSGKYDGYSLRAVLNE